MNVVQNDALPPTVASPSGIPLARRILRPRTLISFAIGLLILGFGVSRLNIDIAGTLRVIGSANWRLYFAAFVVYYCAFPVRALRWRRMLENTGYRRQELPGLLVLGEIIFLSWFVNGLVPAKLGDVYRAYVLRQRSIISGSKGGGTIVAERLLDLAVMLVLLGIAGLLSFRGRLPSTVLTVIEFGFALVLVAGVGLLMMRRLEPLIRRFIPARFQMLYEHFQDGTLGAFGHYPELLGLTLLAWGIETARLYLVTQAIGVALSPNLALNLLMVMFIALGEALLTAPPGTPAGLGYVEATIVGALVLLHIPQTVALSIALLDRSISFLSIVVLGFFVYLYSQRHA
ncbi:MAG TPA: lysylphosphatidylglycerol synthase transmembrane domain-containing protein [Chloroflexota bacterium]|nr:lysylphosphatidylglycerol synthase transmembrane domain-containing protein [Chloroflexota bacterium]